VGPRAILDAVVKRKIPSPRRESNRAVNRMMHEDDDAASCLWAPPVDRMWPDTNLCARIEATRIRPKAVCLGG
jgi:hypothetical protein